MPQIPLHRKTKRATVLTKRIQYLKGKYRKERSYRPLYEKLKHNNLYLAKALAQEKQNCKSLFSQNLALIAETQDLRLSCTSRDNIISTVFNNTKEMLKMLVNITGYMTNTISICQEFATSSANLRTSSISPERKESCRRLSTKSPAKGVVKPMVSGHTITKPTINLSRVNMQNINNTSRLSDIQEVSTPENNRSREINQARSPIAVSIPIIQLHRYENGRTCRLPERLTVSSSRVNKNSKQRLRKKESHPRRSSSFSPSRSNRWSDETLRNSTQHINQLSSPTVKLNDVSKLLQNSQSINIRTLIDDNKIDDIEMQESNDDRPHNTSDKNVTIPEIQLPINLEEVENEGFAQTLKNSNAQAKTRNSVPKDWNKNSNVPENSRPSQNNGETWQDPLEGPSWLLDLYCDSDMTAVNYSDTSKMNNRVLKNNSKVDTTYNDESSDMEDVEDELPASSSSASPHLNDIKTLNKNLPNTDYTRNNYSLEGDAIDDSFCAMLPTTMPFDRERNLKNNEDENTTNMASFITMRRGNSSVREETEDFTLMLSRQPSRKVNFDINELRLPTLEDSMINPIVVDDVDVDNEVTAKLQRISNFKMPSMLHNSTIEPEIDSTTTIKLPLVLVNDHDRVSTPEKGKLPNQKNRKTKQSSSKDSINHPDIVTTSNKNIKRNKLKNNQDPSMAKVVLEKLNESSVQLSADNTMSPTINDDSTNNVSNQKDAQDTNSDNCNSVRPRRKRAVMGLKEPSLRKKLRRNK